MWVLAFLGVVLQDVTVKMYDTLESAPLSLQHSLKSHRAVNSLSSLSAIMTYRLLREVMLGGCHVTDKISPTGEELQVMTTCVHAE